jgi:hypothetical protein
MIYQQVTLSGDAEWPKVADAVIEAVCLLSLYVAAMVMFWHGIAGQKPTARLEQIFPPNPKR